MISFTAKINIIGVNPFVYLPKSVLNHIFKLSQKDKGPIPVRGTIDGHSYLQTLVKYRGEWRLYVNTPMLKACQKKIGERVVLEIEFDPVIRSIPVHPKLTVALNKNIKAKRVFDRLTPSMQKEIVRYISFLKNEISVDRNVKRAVRFLLGKERFIGRDKP